MAKWIFCGGMARSGSTLQFQIASELVERMGVGQRVGWYEKGDFARANLDHGGRDGSLVFKAHRLMPAIAAEVQEHGGLALSTHRDIRDVTASWMSLNDQSFAKVWRSGHLQRWTERFDEWEALPGTYITRYSALRDDLPGEVRRMAQFLDLPAPPSLMDSIATELSLARQTSRAAYQRLAPEQGKHPHTQLHAKHITDAGDGTFSRKLRPFEVDLIERQCADWMMRRGYAASSPRLGLFDRWRQRRLGHPGQRQERDPPVSPTD